MARVLTPFEYFEPETVNEAVRLLSTYGARAKVIAGGVDLVPRIRQRQIRPEYVVSLHHIPGLDYIEGNGRDGLRIGALTNLCSIELSPTVQKDYALLYEAIHQIASMQVRNMATAVGNLCVATPASDVAAAMMALGAKLRTASTAQERVLSIEDFFVGVGQTILQPGEIVTEVLLPGLPTQAGGAFMKLVRTATDVAKVNVAVMLTVTGNTCKDARIALGSVAPTVIRARKAEETLKGQRLEQNLIREAAGTAAQETKPITDIRSTWEYRGEATKALVRRAIVKALQRQKG